MKSIIVVSRNIKYIQGSVYGIPSPVLVGEISITTNATFDTSSLDRFLEENLLFEDIYSKSIKQEIDNLSTEKDDALKLIKKLFYWYNQMHQIIKMPISKKLYINLISHKEGENRYTIAFHSFNPHAAKNILVHLLKIFNSFFLDTQQKTTSKDMHDFLNTLKHFSLGGTNTRYFVQAALDLDIPYRILSNQILLLGQGIYMKKMNSSSTDNTSSIGLMMAKQKKISSEFLRKSGFPVASQLSVNSLENALQYAYKLGYPVVLKPADQDQGRGVSSNIETEKDLINIYKETTKTYKNILIEKHIYGEDYRFTVVDRKVVKIFKRVAGGITGDGKSTVKELVEELQNKVKRKGLIPSQNKFVKLDNEAVDLLSKKKYTVDTILKKDEYVPLRRTNNISTGGKQLLLDNKEVHPDNLDLAIHVAKAFHLDMAGIDIISPDITKSWLNTNSIVCEVNAIPEIGYTLTPTIYQDILKETIGDNVGVPIHLFVVKHELLSDNLFIKRILKQNKFKNFSIGNIVVINHKVFTNRATNSFQAAQILLTNGNVDIAYCFVSFKIIKKFGLPANMFDTIRFDFKKEDVDIIELVNLHSHSLLFKKL